MKGVAKVLRLEVVETSRSVSELVNYAVREAPAEDAEDIAIPKQV